MGLLSGSTGSSPSSSSSSSSGDALGPVPGLTEAHTSHGARRGVCTALYAVGVPLSSIVSFTGQWGHAVTSNGVVADNTVVGNIFTGAPSWVLGAVAHLNGYPVDVMRALYTPRRWRPRTWP